MTIEKREEIIAFDVKLLYLVRPSHIDRTTYQNQSQNGRVSMWPQ